MGESADYPEEPAAGLVATLHSLVTCHPSLVALEEVLHGLLLTLGSSMLGPQDLLVLSAFTFY